MRRLLVTAHLAVCSAALPLAACSAQGTADAPAAGPRIDAAALLADLRVLSADSLEGRATGTPGGARARAYIVRAFTRAGLQPFGASYVRPFTFAARPEGTAGDSVRVAGANVVGYVAGSAHPDRYIVVTAHYDHLGVREGAIYNGADDNASGTATLLALAGHFARNQPRHSIIFAALDAEERGLRGARAFVESPPVDRGAMAVNVNMDMVSHSERGELYVAGTYHTPVLEPHLERVAARSRVKLLFGHDRPGLPDGDDWTNSSDHGAFHRAGIPFVYFGVEDHPDYHKPTDDFETITPDFFTAAAGTIADAIAELDRSLGP
jgi:Zn-dependent M28 family amino/carboxypeptidase